METRIQKNWGVSIRRAGFRVLSMMRYRSYIVWMPRKSNSRSDDGSSEAARRVRSGAGRVLVGDTALGVRLLPCLAAAATSLIVFDLARYLLAPGFAVDWRMRVDPDGQRGGDNGAEARSWETLLSSELGSLQRVDARVGLSGGRVRLTLQANDAALARMRGRVPELVLALEAAGLKLANVDFRAAPATPADAVADDSAP